MRSMAEMYREAEEIMARATDRNAAQVPTQEAIRMAGNVLRLVTCLRHANKFIAHGFMPEWDEYLKTEQLQ